MESVPVSEYAGAIFPCANPKHILQCSTPALKANAACRKWSLRFSKQRLDSIASGFAWEKLPGNQRHVGGGEHSEIWTARHLAPVDKGRNNE